MKAYFNSISFIIPVETCFKIGGKNIISVGFGPQLRIDILSQHRHYDDRYRGVNTAFGFTSKLSYEYVFSTKYPMALGLNNEFNIILYNRPLFSYGIQLYLLVKTSKEKTGKKENREKENKKGVIDGENDEKNEEDSV